MTWLGETTPQPGSRAQWLSGRHRHFRRRCWSCWCGRRSARAFNPWLYWATIVASTTCGTTLADFADALARHRLPGGSLLLLACVLASLFAWYQTLGTVDVNTIVTPAGRGLLLADDHLLADARHRARRLGRRCRARLWRRSAAVWRGAWRCSRSSISRPDQPRSAVLGGVHPDPAARGDGRRLPRQAGGQGRTGLSRPLATAVLAVAIVALILLLPQRPGEHPNAPA